MNDESRVADAAFRPTVHVVICTYNRADQLDLALAALAAMDPPPDGGWEVVVVNNNCTDHTEEVVARYGDRLPGLHSVPEPRQGLTEARQRGFWATEAPWVAFVDDDCRVDPGWISNVLDFIDRQPDAAAFNGLNVLELETDEPKPWIGPSMFAADKPAADGEQVVNALHGAGLVLNREAVVRSGWLDSPRAADRRGNSLVSGGDNELALRAGAAGGDLWFVPQCRLHHKVDAARLRFGYLMRLNYRLAESNPLLLSMRYGGTIWYRRFAKYTAGQIARSLGLKDDHLVMPGSGFRGRLLSLARGAGFTVGAIKLAVSPKDVRREVIGLATPERVDELARGRA